MKQPAPTLGATVRRILRLACPACGRGRLFRRYFVRTEACSCCRWRFERGEGHWVGGSEVHMFLSYGVSVLLCIPVLLVGWTGTEVIAGVIATHVALSLLVFRYSRATFLGLDYLFDPPVRSDDGDDHEGAGEPVRPRPPSLRRSARRIARASHREPRVPVPH